MIKKLKKAVYFVELLLDIAVLCISYVIVTLLYALNIYDALTKFWIFRMIDRALDRITINAIAILAYEFNYDFEEQREIIEVFLSEYGYKL